MTTTDTPRRLSDASIFEAKKFASAMREWTSKQGAGSGLLLVEGAKTIDALLCHIAALTAPPSQWKVERAREIYAQACDCLGYESDASAVRRGSDATIYATAIAAITQALTESSGQGTDGACCEAMEHALKDVIVGALLEYSGIGQGVDDMLFDVSSGQADQIIAAIKKFGHLPLPVSADGSVDNTCGCVLCDFDLIPRDFRNHVTRAGVVYPCTNRKLFALKSKQPSDTEAGK